MKNLILSSLFIFAVFPAICQSVAINTDGTTAHASAILDVKSTSKGVLIPRMTTAQRNAITSPATGLLVFNTTDNTFYYYNAGWKSLKTAKELVDADGNTKVQVEETANDNVIRFDINGNERMGLKENVNGITHLDLGGWDYNYFIGKDVGDAITSGTQNCGFGLRSLWRTTTGSSNVGFGNYSLFDNTSGTGNTALGTSALIENIAGIGNTAVGSSAGYDNLTGNYNTFIGYSTHPTVDSLILSTALGYDAAVTASHQVRIGHSFAASIGGYQNWSNVSDARFKNDVQENVPGLDFITRLRPVTYLLDRNKIARELGQHEMPAVAEPRSTGFLAQEVEATAMALGYEFSGVDAPKNDHDFYGLRYAEFTVPLVKAVQELDAENKLLRAKLASQTEQMDMVLKRLLALEAAVGSGQ